MIDKSRSNWLNAKQFVPRCTKCEEWDKKGLSSRCPSCDSDILLEYERREREELLPIYYYQDGRDFYIFLNQNDVKCDDGLWMTYSSIIKVPDWDLEAAQAARQNFLDAYCKEHFLHPIPLKMF